MWFVNQKNGRPYTIGKRRLEKSIAAYDQPVTVSWHPYQLNPTMPKEGISRREYRMQIRILDGAGEPTKAIPLKDGCFEMQLTKKFFESNPKSFKLEWIDVYRNGAIPGPTKRLAQWLVRIRSLPTVD
jgi:hypothetical protein